MKVLILGGTNYVGRAIAADALARGWDVTLLHRGHTPPPPEWKVKEVLTDRAADLSGADGKFDAVIDVSGYLPSVVRKSAEFFSRKASHYVFISSVSVYDPAADGWLAAKPFHADQVEVVTWETYGPMKLTCERIVEENFGPRTTIIRPGFVVGPYDSTLRMPYWVDRFDRFDKVLVPEDLAVRAQQIDCRDLAALTCLTVEKSYCGIYTAVGESCRFEEIFGMCPGFDPSKLVRAKPEFLEKEGVTIGVDLPLIPGDSFAEAMRNIDCSAALALGLRRRPLAESLADTLAWLKSRPDRESRLSSPGKGLSREREEEIISRLEAGG